MVGRTGLKVVRLFDRAKHRLIIDRGKDQKTAKWMIEREDGIIYEDYDYLYQGPESVFGYEARLFNQVKSPVLDLGCGPGRIATPLSQMGHTVVGIDISAEALITLQGLTGMNNIATAQMSINQPGFASESFSTIVAMGFNIGAAGNLAGLRTLFEQLRRCCLRRGRFLLTSVDVSKRWDYESYFLVNVSKGRDKGQSRLRFRKGDMAKEWFDWIYVFPDDLHAIAGQTGWKVNEITYDDKDPQYYAAVLENPL